jgi:hypothetical protein
MSFEYLRAAAREVIDNHFDAWYCYLLCVPRLGMSRLLLFARNFDGFRIFVFVVVCGMIITNLRMMSLCAAVFVIGRKRPSCVPRLTLLAGLSALDILFSFFMPLRLSNAWLFI